MTEIIITKQQSESSEELVTQDLQANYAQKMKPELLEIIK